jgi:hypothetical protein
MLAEVPSVTENVKAGKLGLVVETRNTPGFDETSAIDGIVFTVRRSGRSPTPTRNEKFTAGLVAEERL